VYGGMNRRSCACSGRTYWQVYLSVASWRRSCSRSSTPSPFSRPALPSALTHLEIYVHKREHPPDAGAVGLWELLASRTLPALAKLRVRLERQWGSVEDVRTRVAPAFEAVAGTLMHLDLNGGRVEVGVGYELGVALSRLRRLKDLTLGLSRDGRVYHAVAQGLAASGDDHPPLPLLWRMRVLTANAHADLLVSLLLPSVRIFVTSSFPTDQAVLLLACALRRVGYKHSWAVDTDLLQIRHLDVLREIARCGVDDSFIHDGWPSDRSIINLTLYTLWDCW
jgi:hypothetical protein